MAQPEKLFWQQVRKNLTAFSWIRLESRVNHGIPDVLGTTEEGIYFTVELKVTNTTKVKFSPHQILFHTTHTKRNFILVEQATKGSPRSIKLYGCNAIHGLLADYRETPCIAQDDWDHIQRVFINTPSDG